MIYIIIICIVKWWRPDVYFTFNVYDTRARTDYWRYYNMTVGICIPNNDMGGNGRVVPTYTLLRALNNLISSNLDTRHTMIVALDADDDNNSIL